MLLQGLRLRAFELFSWDTVLLCEPAALPTASRVNRCVASLWLKPAEFSLSSRTHAPARPPAVILGQSPQHDHDVLVLGELFLLLRGVFLDIRLALPAFLRITVNRHSVDHKVLRVRLSKCGTTHSPAEASPCQSA